MEIKPKPQTMSIDMDFITVMDMLFLLSQHDGYIDGDKRTLELYVT
jgi:hypothetical protein